ncbi:MAG: hypothetical protein WBG20_09350 [Candidatus Deferrimicrobiaceae bacterium]
MAPKKKTDFKDFEVEHDDQSDEVTIKNKKTGETKKAKKHDNPSLEVLGPNGMEIPAVDGTKILTSVNPTCYWYYSRGQWHVYCI